MCMSVYIDTLFLGLHACPACHVLIGSQTPGVRVCRAAVCLMRNTMTMTRVVLCRLSLTWTPATAVLWM